MSVIPSDVERTDGDAGWGLQRPWQEIARALDRLVVKGSQRAVSHIALRRSKYDFNRCRRLMLQASTVPLPSLISSLKGGHHE
jgi:hypothetical protein